MRRRALRVARGVRGEPGRAVKLSHRAQRPSQQRAIRSALRTASMDASAVDGLEMHGTGTSLGDPIEVGAAHAVLVESNSATRLAPLTMSAMKSCMGHTEPAAGAVGLLHAVLGAGALSARGIVHLKAINPHLASLTRNATSRAVDAMALPRQHLAAAACAAQRPAQRGVSSFAFQGTNAHVIAAAASASDVAGMATRGRAATWHRERLWIAAAKPPRGPFAVFHLPFRPPRLLDASPDSPIFQFAGNALPSSARSPPPRPPRAPLRPATTSSSSMRRLISLRSARSIRAEISGVDGSIILREGGAVAATSSRAPPRRTSSTSPPAKVPIHAHATEKIDAPSKTNHGDRARVNGVPGAAAGVRASTASSSPPVTRAVAAYRAAADARFDDADARLSARVFGDATACVAMDPITGARLQTYAGMVIDGCRLRARRRRPSDGDVRENAPRFRDVDASPVRDVLGSDERDARDDSTRSFERGFESSSRRSTVQDGFQIGRVSSVSARVVEPSHAVVAAGRFAPAAATLTVASSASTAPAVGPTPDRRGVVASGDAENAARDGAVWGALASSRARRGPFGAAAARRGRVFGRHFRVFGRRARPFACHRRRRRSPRRNARGHPRARVCARRDGCAP